MNKKQYTVVVAGVGKRGRHHVSAYNKNPRFKVIGLSDIDPARIEAAQKEYGITAGDTDAARLLKELRPDIFCFCTLPNVRLDLIKAGVEAGVKLIDYEKPMATSMSDAVEIMRLLKEGNVKSVVSHQHRYGAHYRAVKEIIASGAIGRVHTVYGTAQGWMLHMMTHLIDYMRWYNDNAEAQWVMGQAGGTKKFSDIHKSPDYISGTIQFANGVRGIVECGAGAPDVPEVDYWWRKCRIGAQGTEGFAEVLTGNGWRAVTRTSNGVISGTGSMDYELDTPPYIQDIAEWLDDETKVHPCNGESAYKGLEIMMGICRSVVGRGQVTLPLGPDKPEIDEMEKVLAGTKTISTTEETAKQYV
jgi:predicted dehydrogenase